MRSLYFKIPFYCVFIVLDFRHMWRVRTRPLQLPPFRPSAGAPPTSPRWRTLASTVWCCCSPTEMVESSFWTIVTVFPAPVRSDRDWAEHVFAETVVAESVVVIKKLLQTQPSQHSEIIKHMAKLFDNITVCFTFLHPLLIHTPSYQHGSYI